MSGSGSLGLGSLGSGSLGSGSLGSGSLGSGSLGRGSSDEDTFEEDTFEEDTFEEDLFEEDSLDIGSLGQGSMGQGSSSICTTTVMANIRNFSTWKSSVSTTLNSIASSSTPTPVQEATLNTASADILQTVSCMNEIVNNLSGLTNNIQGLQDLILSSNKELAQAEEHVSIARDRVGYIRNPDKNTSFYESWFPLDRPMQPTSIPVFVAVNTFLFMAGIFLLMTFFGFKISFPESTNSGISTSRFSLSDSLLLLLVGFIIYHFLLRK